MSVLLTWQMMCNIAISQFTVKKPSLLVSELAFRRVKSSTKTAMLLDLLSIIIRMQKDGDPSWSSFRWTPTHRIHQCRRHPGDPSMWVRDTCCCSKLCICRRLCFDWQSTGMMQTKNSQAAVLISCSQSKHVNNLCLLRTFWGHAELCQANENTFSNFALRWKKFVSVIDKETRFSHWIRLCKNKRFDGDFFAVYPSRPPRNFRGGMDIFFAVFCEKLSL